MNEPNPYDPKSLQLIFSVLLMVQLGLATFVGYSAPEQSSLRFDLYNLSHYIIPLSAALLDGLGTYSWNRGMKLIGEQEEMDDKLRILANMHLWRWVPVQLATMVLLTYTLLEANYFYYLFGLVNIIYFYTLRPKIFSFT